MGCVVSSPETDENDPILKDQYINDAIEQTLSANKVNEKDQFKLLLLGAGESGKSTVLKQMKVLHKGGFTQRERVQYSQIIWCDTIQTMKILIDQARKLGIELDSANDPKLQVCTQIILDADALQQIDTGAAGGTDFLNDYVLKYNESTQAKRRLASTGAADGAFWEDNDEEAGDSTNSSGEDTPTRTTKRPYSRVEIAEAITQLWTRDSGIQRCYDRSHEFQLESSASYYFDNCMKFADPNYYCSDVDILHGRIKTTGITETNFVINSFKFKVLDAGGQRSERKKWIHCFDNITAILFVLAISEYDQTLFEDERVNRMHESIVLFEALCNSKWFINTPFILFLNKIDLFEKKLPKSPLKKYFPDYNGKPGNVEEAIKFFETNFLKLNKTSKPIYVHRTCATDTKSMKFVLSAVTDLIVQKNLKKSGII